MPNAIVHVRGVAEQQWGVIARWQLLDCGLSAAGVTRWVDGGRLHRLYPGVFALGHRRVSSEAELVAALLHAGPGAILSHSTAAWWWQLIDKQPPMIHVSVPGRRSSTGRIRIHDRRTVEQVSHRRLPVTTAAQTLLDLAAIERPGRVRRALAEADYRGLLDAKNMEKLVGRGRRGSTRLRSALKHHQPRLALTRSVLEERFLGLCESAGVPLPEINARIEGLRVDALWRREHVIVELDGHAGHSSPAQLQRDRDRDLRLRAAGFMVLRYTWQQLTEEPELVIADLQATLRVRGGAAPSSTPASV